MEEKQQEQTMKENTSETNNKEKKVTKDMTFAEIMDQDPEMQEKLMMMGLGCGGCPMAQMESIEGGAHAHGINPEELVNEINKQMNTKQENKT